MLPEQFPSDEHMFEFMLSYLQELFPNKDDESLQEKAHQMVEVWENIYLISVYYNENMNNFKRNFSI
jgi:hypothetical protein